MEDKPIRPISDSRIRLILDSSTSLELLAAIKNNSSESWPVFVKKYSRLLRRWCEEWKADSEDTEDVVQETLLELFQKINDYKVQPNATFRAWLKKVAYYRYLKILRKSRRLHVDDETLERRRELARKKLESSQVCDSFMELIDLIADQELIEIACRRIAKRLDMQNWQIFVKREFEEIPSKIVAAEFGLSVNAIDVITFRVRRMIRAELEMLDPHKRD